MNRPLCSLFAFTLIACSSCHAAEPADAGPDGAAPAAESAADATDADADADADASFAAGAPAAFEPAVAGAWVFASGAVTLRSGGETRLLPQPARRATFEWLGPRRLRATLPDGCVLDYRLAGHRARLLGPTTCDVQTPEGPSTQRVDRSSIQFRSADESSLRLDATLETPSGHWALGVDAQLTREAAVAPPGPVERVASFAPGAFLESVAVDAAGELYVTRLVDNVDADLVRLRPGEPPRSAAAYPAGATGTLAFDAKGALYGTVGGFATAVTPSIVRVEPDGRLVTEATLPDGAAPNGIAVGPGGDLFVADSNLGLVWRLRPGAGRAEVWAEGGALAADRALGFPGPNGIKFFGQHVYVSNPSTLSIVRARVGDVGRPGAFAPYVRGLGVDDFAFDEGGNLYATTHPFNTLALVRPDRSVRLLLTSAQGLWGPTSAAFGRRPGDERSLYVVTDGNLFGAALPPPAGESTSVFAAEVLRIDVGRRGAPLP